jgi:hypothetical protein
MSTDLQNLHSSLYLLIAWPKRSVIYLCITNRLQYIITIIKKAITDMDDIRHKNRESIRKIACKTTGNVLLMVNSLY